MPVVTLETIIEALSRVERRLHPSLGEARSDETREALMEVLSWVEDGRLTLSRASDQFDRRFEQRAVLWPQACDFPPVVEASVFPSKGCLSTRSPTIMRRRSAWRTSSWSTARSRNPRESLICSTRLRPSPLGRMGVLGPQPIL